MKYEYLTKNAYLFVEESLEACGEQGWELVTVIHIREGGPYELFFKRPLPYITEQKAK